MSAQIKSKTQRHYKDRPVKVIALDDDKLIRKILLGMFRDKYDFTVVGTVSEFKKAVTEKNPDVVLIDVILPDGNGIDVCKWLREHTRYEQLFILIITSFEDVASIESAYRAGANDYIRKPFIPFEVMSKIHHISRTLRYEHEVIHLSNHHRQSRERLMQLTDLINRNIHITDKEDLFASLFDAAKIINCDYCELKIHDDENGIKTQTRSFNSQFDPIQSNLLINKTENTRGRWLTAGRSDKTKVYCYTGSILCNNNIIGTIVLQSIVPFQNDAHELVALYTNFVNLLGMELSTKAAMRSEITRERKEIAKVRSLQVSLLPHFNEIDQYDISSTFIPMEDISGDFFDGYYIKEGVYLIILCDVSGHGVASSFIGSSIRGLLRAVDYSRYSPAEIVSQLNDAVVKNLSNIYYFSSMVLCVLEVATGKITIVSAGHPPCLYYNNTHRQYAHIENTGPLIGLMQGSTYDQHELTLDKGDCLLMYTDGIIESPAEIGSDMFGENRLFHLFSENVQLQSLEIVHTILGAVYEHTGFTSLNDDATVICIKRK